MSTLRIITDKMVFGGDCIAKNEGKMIFVPFAIPGEELEVEITDEKRDYCTARIVSIIKPSEHRTVPFCPLYGKCGGCNMQHIDSDYQIILRSQILKEAFEHEILPKLPDAVIPEIEVISGSPVNYRSRFQFHDGGLMAKSSNNVLPLENCPCAVKEINEWLKSTEQKDRPKGRVHVFASQRLVSAKGIPVPENADALRKVIVAKEKKSEESEMKNQITQGRNKKKLKNPVKRFSGTLPDFSNNCAVQIGGKNISFDVQGFFQSNLDVLEKTITTLTDGLEGENALDMYCGAGTFSVFLAQKFRKVTLVEHNRDAIVYAEQNMAGLNHESFGVSGERWVTSHAASCISQNGEFDAVVIDPPRSGMEKAVCQWLCASGIPEIRSISCDIATHARDAKFLMRSGYRLTKLYLLDFYPQTCHIESLAIFQK